jgi:hypothetical protein
LTFSIHLKTSAYIDSEFEQFFNRLHYLNEREIFVSVYNTAFLAISKRLRQAQAPITWLMNWSAQSAQAPAYTIWGSTHTGPEVLGLAKAYGRSVPARIDHLRACAGTLSFAYASINQWRADTDRHRPANSLC